MGKVSKEELESQPAIIQAAYQYLSSLNVSLWGNWLIRSEGQEQNRLLAAKWLVDQMKGVALHSDLGVWMELFGDRSQDGE